MILGILPLIFTYILVDFLHRRIGTCQHESDYTKLSVIYYWPLSLIYVIHIYRLHSLTFVLCHWTVGKTTYGQ